MTLTGRTRAPRRSQQRCPNGLTQTQRQVFRFIVAHMRRFQRFPQHKSIALYIGCRHAVSVQRHLRRLEQKGLLSCDPEQIGSWTLTGLRVVLDYDPSPAGQLARAIVEGVL